MNSVAQADTVSVPTKTPSRFLKAYDAWRLATLLFDTLVRPLSTGTTTWPEGDGDKYVVLPREHSTSPRPVEDVEEDRRGGARFRNVATTSLTTPSAVQAEELQPQEPEAPAVRLQPDDEEEEDVETNSHSEHLPDSMAAAAEPAGPCFVQALADTLFRVAATGSRSPVREMPTPFHAHKVPQITLHDYAVRIARHFQCSDECFVLALVYIDRVVKLHPDFSIDERSVHRLLLASATLAAKFFDDVYYGNAYYAKVGGVRTSEINTLEIQLLRMLQWRLHVFPEEYAHYREHVLAAATWWGPPADTAVETVDMIAC